MKKVISAVSRLARRLIASAYFWYVALTVTGALTLAHGIAIQFGRGYGFIALGVLALVGSEAIRNGLRRG